MSKILVVGSINMDLILRMPHMPAVGETIRATGFQTAAGGKGFNQAVAIKRMGSQTAFYGYLGTDGYGEDLKGQLVAEGIDPGHLKISAETPTGMAFILLDAAGHNSIVVQPGSNLCLSVPELTDILESSPEVETLVVQMEIPTEVIEAVLTEGRRLGKKVVLNPSPYQPLRPELLAGLDTLILNEIEAAQMTGFTDITAQIEALKNMGIRQIILTHGADGVYFNDGLSVIHQPAFPAVVVDTTGAGDTFLGTYVSQIQQGKSLREAVELAAKAGAKAVSKLGAKPSIPFLEEIL